MKTAVLVQSHSGANPLVARHYPWWRKSGLDLFGIGRENTNCVWPKEMPSFRIGQEGKSDLSDRLVKTFDLFLSDPRFDGYTHCMVIESDAIFLAPPPYDHIEAAATHAGGPIAGLKAKEFFHTPWWLSRAMAERFVAMGASMVKRGDVEKNTPDFFITLAFEYLKEPIGWLAGTYSRNTLDIQRDLLEVRGLVRDKKLWYVHGLKTQQQLDFITH